MARSPGSLRIRSVLRLRAGGHAERPGIGRFVALQQVFGGVRSKSTMRLTRWQINLDILYESPLHELVFCVGVGP